MTMQPLTQRFPLPPASFTFAGFRFPRFMPPAVGAGRGTVRNRIDRRRHPSVGPYRTAPVPNSGGPWGFYLDADAPFELRLRPAHEILPRAVAVGWYCSEDECGDAAYGIVAALAHGRGFLSGWTLGEGMIGALEPTIYADEVSAAIAADDAARLVAEREREREAATCSACQHEHERTDWKLCDGCGEPQPDAELPESWFDAHVPSHWLSALVNGDESGLEPDDAAELERFCARNPGSVIHYTDAGFRRWHDGGPLAADCARIWIDSEA